VYSTYSEPLSVGYNLHALPASQTNFRKENPLVGHVEAAVGHRNSHLLFGYQTHKKNNSLDLYAKHHAYWGKDALSQSMAGVQFTHHFRGADFYVGAEGINEAYLYPSFFDWRNLCTGNANIGIRSTNKKNLQYHIQTGYTAFVTETTIEHHAKSHLNLAWNHKHHGVGLASYVQNTFYSILDTTLNAPSAHHNIRIEPFYTYTHNNIRLHVGVNLNMNIGTGNLLSTIENLSFAPSPNVEFEWNTFKNKLNIYATAKGYYGLGSLEESLAYNRLFSHNYITPTPRAYTPIDAQLGFKLRPIKTLLIDLYGGYIWTKNAYNTSVIILGDNSREYHLWLSDQQYGKVGAKVHYHYRDIIELNASGNYYIWSQTHYDTPDWDIHARLDVHFTSQWSIYSDNHFAGSRVAKTSLGDQTIKPTIALNLGAQYKVNRWLSAYIQLNDYINRKDEIFYGYHSQGIHFLLGITYKF
jgi:hypothetical protein